MPLSNSRAVRKQLDHSIHFDGRFGAVYFITICCEQRGHNELCLPSVAGALFETATIYHRSQRWHVEVFLLMPDHLHALIGFQPDRESLSNVIRSFKRITTKTAPVHWQRGFFDHRLRNDESMSQKADYIVHNPVRAGLSESPGYWKYLITRESIENSSLAPPGD